MRDDRLVQVMNVLANTFTFEVFAENGQPADALKVASAIQAALIAACEEAEKD